MAVQHLTDPEGERFDDKRLFPFRPGRRSEPETKQPVDGALVGIAGTPHLQLHEFRHVIVNAESGSHIMMLDRQTS
jgi:hypothetical protein